MTVKDLRKLLKGIPDDTTVLIPLNPTEGFTGEFFSPCNEESGKIELGLEDLDDDEVTERKLLGNLPKTEPSFALVPCGFFQEHEGPHPQLN